MTEIVLQHKRGTLIAFESGEYSDFNFNGMLVALHDLDLRKLAREYVAENYRKMSDDERQWDNPEKPDGFMGWLVANQHAAPINYSTVHLGGYGSFDEPFEIPDSDALKAWLDSTLQESEA